MPYLSLEHSIEVIQASSEFEHLRTKYVKSVVGVGALDQWQAENNAMRLGYLDSVLDNVPSAADEAFAEFLEKGAYLFEDVDGYQLWDASNEVFSINKGSLLGGEGASTLAALPSRSGLVLLNKSVRRIDLSTHESDHRLYPVSVEEAVIVVRAARKLRDVNWLLAAEQP